MDICYRNIIFFGVSGKTTGGKNCVQFRSSLLLGRRYIFVGIFEGGEELDLCSFIYIRIYEKKAVHEPTRLFQLPNY